MKTLFLFLSLSVIFTSLNAQEFSVKYQISMESSDAKMQEQLQMSQGSTLHVFTKDNKSRVEINMGQLMKTTTILDSEEGKGLIFMDGVLGKQAASFEGEDFENYKTEKAEDEITITHLDSVKTILGQTCSLAIATIEGEDLEVEFWYNKNIDGSRLYMLNNTNYKLPGLVLEYVIEQPDVNVSFKAISFEDKIENEELFDTAIPEGYIEKSFLELTNMSGQ